jgi:FkbM family methyltransferase
VCRNAWEAPVVEAFARAVRPGDVVYDVGAWIGPYTLLASKLVGPTGRVYAFEPDPVARRRLERNVTANGAQNVEVAPLALGRSSGSAFFSGGGSRGSVGQTGEVAVATVSLGEFAEQTGRAPDLMKVDIEGGELGLDTAALREVPQLFLEVHAPAFHREGVDPERFLREVAGEREVLRLEGGAENFNVRIGGAGSAPGAPQSRAGASSTRS